MWQLETASHCCLGPMSTLKRYEKASSHSPVDAGGRPDHPLVAWGLVFGPSRPSGVDLDSDVSRRPPSDEWSRTSFRQQVSAACKELTDVQTPQRHWTGVGEPTCTISY